MKPLAKSFFLAVAICLLLVSVFAQNVSDLNDDQAPATAGIETRSFPTQTSPRTNQTEIIKVKTAHGKLGRKNRDSTEQLTFTEVDLSKYQSGRVFAEIKVSGGGCDAALVGTTVPSQDRKRLVEYARAGSGGSNKGDLFDMSLGQIFLQGKKVNKFFVSGALIPIGIIAWYSKDCVGSYEINVYIKNASAGAGTAPNQSSCKDNDIRLTYNPQALNYHSYKASTLVCSTYQANCTVDRVFSTLTSKVQYVVPDTTSNLRVTNCMTFDADIPGPFNQDPIRIVVNRSDYSVTNYTRKGHVFHPGKVTRTIVQKGGP